MFSMASWIIVIFVVCWSSPKLEEARLEIEEMRVRQKKYDELIVKQA